MNVQQHYWDTFANLKRDSYYLHLYYVSEESTDRLVNVFSAVTSSTSIAGWSIWQSYAFFWGGVIAVSQVLNAVKPYLPYHARLKALSALVADVDALALTAETDWYKVERGLLTEEEIFQLSMNLKKAEHQATQAHFANMTLPQNRNLLIMADRNATNYLKKLTGI